MSSASPGRGGAPRPLPTPQDISIPPISAPFSRLSTTRPSPSPTGRRVMHADGTMSGGGGGGGAGGGGVGSGGGQRRNVTPPRNHLSMNLAPEDDSEAAERDMLHSETDMEGELLGQLQELHRQLAELRQQSNREERERQLFDTSSKLIVCATTKPVRLVKAKEGDAQWIYEEYKGRFRSAIDSLAGTNRVRWVSWPGTTVDLGSQESVRRRLDSEFACTPVFLSHEVANAYYHKFCHGVLWPLFHCINTNFFNEGLLESFMEQYDAYVHANQCYLEVVADTYEPGDLVLVLDYELMLLPMLLRKRFPDVVCGFFLHCPFPSSEFYRMLPVRQTLLQGILGADLVSFNHFDYVRHFLTSCTRILGLESFPSRVEHNGRLVSLAICPAGIQPEDYELTPEVHRHMETLSTRYAGMKVIVSVDRLDVSKGLPQKLIAFESLLENYPEWRGQVIMFVILRDRTRGFIEDRSLGRTVDGLVGRVNGRYGHTDYCPVKYVKGDLTNEEVIALNALADVKLVTSIREGINLGAMEFIACQQQTRHGVLIYSEFAGCSTDFKGALIINPYDADKVAESVHVALTMSSTTKQIRNHQLSRYVNTYTSALWARRMISSLQQAGEKAREYNKLQRLDMTYFQAFYERSRKRLLIFDYDGTLVPYHSLPQLAAPPAELIACLEALCDDPLNLVFVISGRRKDDLQEWLGHIPNLGLLAENGYWCRIPSELHHRAHGGLSHMYQHYHPYAHHSHHLSHPSGASLLSSAYGEGTNSPLTAGIGGGGGRGGREGERIELESPAPSKDSLLGVNLDIFSSNASATHLNVFNSVEGVSGGNPVLSWDGWISKANHVDLSWKVEVMDIFESFTDRTPGSFLEVKDSCLSWHYRDADADFGIAQAKNLHQHLDQMLKHQPVRVITCPVKKYIVIHPSRLNKGRALVHLLQDFGAAASSSSTAFNSNSTTAIPLSASAPSLISLPATLLSNSNLSAASDTPGATPVEGGREGGGVAGGGGLGGGGEGLDLDFVLVVGDERTDEDMFDVLQGSTAFAVLRSHHIAKFVPGAPSRGHCFTVTVGRKISRAQYFLDDPKEVRRMLELLAERSTGMSALGSNQGWREGGGHVHHSSMNSLSSLNAQSD